MEGFESFLPAHREGWPIGVLVLRGAALPHSNHQGLATSPGGIRGATPCGLGVEVPIRSPSKPGGDPRPSGLGSAQSRLEVYNVVVQTLQLPPEGKRLLWRFCCEPSTSPLFFLSPSYALPSSLFHKNKTTTFSFNSFAQTVRKQKILKICVI